jgi:hypothetical protein
MGLARSGAVGQCFAAVFNGEHGMGPDKEVFEAARDLRLSAREALGAFEQGDASLIASASAEVFACADELAKQSQMKERAQRGITSQLPHSSPLMGLAGRAFENDFGEGVIAVASRAQWLASRCASKEESRTMWLQLGAVAADGKALDCVKSLARMSSQSAWTMAALCAPGASGAFEDLPRSGKTSKEGWEQGFRAALEAALAQGHDVAAGSQALALAAHPHWAGASRAGVFDGALSTAEALSGAGFLDARGAWAAACLAVEPGPWTDRALSVADQAARRLGLDMSQGAPSGLGLPTGHKKLRECVCHFGDLIHPAWLAAARATAEHPDGARKILELWGPAQGEGPKIAPTVEGLSHPLTAVWEVWNNSRRAGRALPSKPIQVARQQLIKSAAAWRGRASEEMVSGWKRDGMAALSALEAGHVPADVGGWTQRPHTEGVKEELSSRLSPLGWRMGTAGVANLEDLVAVGRAQALLGYRIEDSARQARALGVNLSDQAVAELERLTLEQTLAPALEKTSRGPRL